jgi:hypothetical protein
MRIDQKPTFEPITITLESRKEAETFWGIMCDHKEPEIQKLKNKLSDWFTNNYK